MSHRSIDNCTGGRKKDVILPDSMPLVISVPLLAKNHLTEGFPVKASGLSASHWRVTDLPTMTAGVSFRFTPKIKEKLREIGMARLGWLIGYHVK